MPSPSCIRAGLAALALATTGLAACDRHSDSHLREAGAEAKAAVVDVGKAVDASAPAIKNAGARIGHDLRAAGDKAGRDLKDAGHKAGEDIHDADHRAQDAD